MHNWKEIIHHQIKTTKLLVASIMISRKTHLLKKRLKLLSGILVEIVIYRQKFLIKILLSTNSPIKNNEESSGNNPSTIIEESTSDKNHASFRDPPSSASVEATSRHARNSNNPSSSTILNN